MTHILDNTNKLEMENKELKISIENLWNKNKGLNIIENKSNISILKFTNNIYLAITIPRKDYLENKFLIRITENQFIYRCLTKDILDYREFIKERMKSINMLQEELISLVQEAVNEVSTDYEVYNLNKLN